MVTHNREVLAQRSLVVLLCVLTFAAFGLVGHNWYLNRSLAQVVALANGETPLEYGDHVDPNALQRALQQVGRHDSFSPRDHILLYFVRPSHFSHLKPIKYGNVLLQRYNSRGLRVFLVTDAQQNEVEIMVEREALTIPVLYDRNSVLRLLLRAPDYYEHTFLLTSEGKVVFSLAGAPSEDLTRQIVEKYVVGKIDYSHDSAQQHYRIGETLPNIRVASVASGPVQDLAPRDAEVVLISARCTSCQLHAYMQRYRELAGASTHSKPRFLVFSGRFSQQELLTDLTEGGVAIDRVYIAREPLGDLDSEYRTKSDDAELAVVVGVDAQGRIESVRSLDEVK